MPHCDVATVRELDDEWPKRLCLPDVPQLIGGHNRIISQAAKQDVTTLCGGQRGGRARISGTTAFESGAGGCRPLVPHDRPASPTPATAEAQITIGRRKNYCSLEKKGHAPPAPSR